MANKTPKAKKNSVEERPVKYPTREATVCDGEHALKEDYVTDTLLGWEYVDGDNYLFQIPKGYGIGGDEGRKVWCRNNDHNRPFDIKDALKYGQDVLNKRWKCNGETVIVGKTGRILSAQHRLVGFKLACMIWRGNQKHHWQEIWPECPVLETFVSWGIDEDEATVMTLDNVRTRTFADSMFTQPEFGKLSTQERKKRCRMHEYAIRFLWHRTGADNDSFNPHKSIAALKDFADRHPTLIKCVNHIAEENKSGELSKIIPPGTASAMMYLMSVSNSDIDRYINGNNKGDYDHSEKVLETDLFKKAQEFWVLLRTPGGRMLEAKMSLAALDRINQVSKTPVSHKIATLSKAWKVFAAGDEFSKDDKRLHLRYGPEGKNGVRTIAENPTFGGIDLGEPLPEKEEPKPTPPPIDVKAPPTPTGKEKPAPRPKPVLMSGGKPLQEVDASELENSDDENENITDAEKEEKETDKEEGDDNAPYLPTKEEIETEAKRIREEKEANGKKATPKPKRTIEDHKKRLEEMRKQNAQ